MVQYNCRTFTDYTNLVLNWNMLSDETSQEQELWVGPIMLGTSSHTAFYLNMMKCIKQVVWALKSRQTGLNLF